MRILVFGAGAVGSVLGGLLAKAGHDVTLLGRAWHLDVVREQGLAIAGRFGTHRITHLSTATRIEGLAAAPFDWILVCVKAHDTPGAAEAVAGLLGPRTLVCSFQNGLGNYEALARRIPPERVALGRVIFGAELEPGAVTVTVNQDDVLIGAPDRRVPEAALSGIAASLRTGGVPCRVSATILRDVWAKVLYNCALNGLSMLLEVPYGALLQHPTAPRMMRAVVEEGYRVAAAQRIALLPASAEAFVTLLFTRLIPETASHHSSMLQDLLRGRPTEIEALNGALARLARAAGLPAATNELITRLVHAKERMALPGEAPPSGQ